MKKTLITLVIAVSMLILWTGLSFAHGRTGSRHPPAFPKQYYPHPRGGAAPGPYYHGPQTRYHGYKGYHKHPRAHAYPYRHDPGYHRAPGHWYKPGFWLFFRW